MGGLLGSRFKDRALQVRRTYIGRHCNSVETDQPSYQTTDPDIMRPAWPTSVAKVLTQCLDMCKKEPSW